MLEGVGVFLRCRACGGAKNSGIFFHKIKLDITYFKLHFMFDAVASIIMTP